MRKIRVKTFARFNSSKHSKEPGLGMTHKSEFRPGRYPEETADVIIALLLDASRAADILHQASPAAVTEETDMVL